MTGSGGGIGGRGRAAVLGALLLVFLWNALYYTPYVVDDAFISFRYARNLVEGHGLVYNPGERVEGYSNFLWVLLEAGLLAGGLPILIGTKALGLASGIATVLMTYALGRRLFAERPSVALLAAGLLCFHTSLAVWCQAGLETVFFAALIVAMCLRYEVELGRPGAPPLSALLFGLAWMTRPEAPLYGLYFLVRRLGRGRAPLGRRDAVWLAVLGAIVVAYEVWGLWYYGALLPATHAAKLGEGVPLLAKASTMGLARSQLVQFVFGQGWGFAALLAAGVAGCVRARSVPTAVWAPLASAAVFLLYAWTDWMPRYRFVVPVLPAVCLLIAHGVAALADAVRGRRAAGLAAAVLVAAALLGYAGHQMFGAYYRVRPRRSYELAAGARGWWLGEVPRNLGRRVYPVHNSAWTIMELTPRDELVALADIGLPGYLAANPIWDLRGLVTPAAARSRLEDPAGVQAAVDDLLERRVALILIPSNPPKGIANLEQALSANPRVERRYRRIESEDGARVRYERRDLQRVPRARIARALAGFPEYDSPRAKR